jgi:hypothetical protein
MCCGKRNAIESRKKRQGDHVERINRFISKNAGVKRYWRAIGIQNEHVNWKSYLVGQVIG